MSRSNYIEICGNIASGKTTLCGKLTGKGFVPVFEDFQNNPFFNDFYNDPIEYSFETEVTFLLQHYHLIKKQKEELLLVCDYSLFLDLAYADVNLDGNRHKIFLEIVEELQNEIAPPSQIINLICPEDILLQRIIHRSREVETTITIEYLKSLSKAISLRMKEVSSKILVTTIDSNATNFQTSVGGIKELETL
jgi:deoxyadenosine/deoxycytidine kinase